MKAQSSGPPEYRVPPPHHPLQNPELTLAGAEAEPTVSVKVSSGAAPEHVVRAAVCGAGGVGAAIEGEGEVAGSAIRVPKAGWNHCRRRGTRVREDGHGHGKKRVWGPRRRRISPTPLPRDHNSSSSKWASPWMPWPGGKACARSPSFPSKGYPSPCSEEADGKKRVSWVQGGRLSATQGRWTDWGLKSRH